MNMEQLKNYRIFLIYYKLIISDSDADILLTLIQILHRRKTLKTIKTLKNPIAKFESESGSFWKSGTGKIMRIRTTGLCIMSLPLYKKIHFLLWNPIVFSSFQRMSRPKKSARPTLKSHYKLSLAVTSYMSPCDDGSRTADVLTSKEVHWNSEADPPAIRQERRRCKTSVSDPYRIHWIRILPKIWIRIIDVS